MISSKNVIDTRTVFASGYSEPTRPNIERVWVSTVDLHMRPFRLHHLSYVITIIRTGGCGSHTDVWPIEHVHIFQVVSVTSSCSPGESLYLDILYLHLLHLHYIYSFSRRWWCSVIQALQKGPAEWWRMTWKSLWQTGGQWWLKEGQSLLSN